jgi:hypothetical protein
MPHSGKPTSRDLTVRIGTVACVIVSDPSDNEKREFFRCDGLRVSPIVLTGPLVPKSLPSQSLVTANFTNLFVPRPEVCICGCQGNDAYFIGGKSRNGTALDRLTTNTTTVPSYSSFRSPKRTSLRSIGGDFARDCDLPQPRQGGTDRFRTILATQPGECDVR